MGANGEEDDRRSSDRRTGQGGYDGPERRIADRRLPEGSPATRPDLAALSDIDLQRAQQRAVDDEERGAISREITRREATT